MKKGLLFCIAILIPLLILLLLYFNPHKNQVEENFSRTFFRNDSFKITDTITLKPGVPVDNILVDNGDLWLNERSNIAKLSKPYKEEVVITKRNGLLEPERPIINFYIDSNVIYAYQANNNFISVLDLNRDSLIRQLNVDFPVSYFVKLKNHSFLFQEIVSGKAGSQLHFKDYDNKNEWISHNGFLNEEGADMKYAGCWFSNTDKTRFFYVPFRADTILCFVADGTLKYKLAPIDSQNQELKIIKEDKRYYLSPDANLLRLGACASKNNLFVSSFVRAKNQSKTDFRNNMTIDVYNIEDGKYKYSLHLPDFFGRQSTDFVISDSTLYALYDYDIVLYDLPNRLKYEN